MVFSGKSIRSVENKFLNKLIQRKDEPVVEGKADVWRSMYPFFCDQALSTPVVAIESLKILDVLIDYGIVGDYKNLQKVLLHNSDEVARLALDVLRKIKGLTRETRIEGAEIVSAESGVESMENVLPTKDQQLKIEQLVQNEKNLQSRVLSFLKNEDMVSEKLTDIEKKVEELGQKIPEVPSNLTQDYDNKFKALEEGIEELRKLMDSNIVSENALAEKFVAEKLTDIEKKVEALGQKIPEAPSNLTQDYDNKFKALEEGIEELKKLINSNIANENALAEKVAGQVLERIKPEHISKSGISPVPQFTQKTAEDSQYSKDQEVRVPSLDNTPETSVILLNWAKFLMEKVGRNKLADILEYYVEIGWISEEVSSVIAEYANGIDYYVETPAGDLLPEVHTKSFLFIEQLRRRKMDKKHSSFSTSGYGSIIPTQSL
ncbi:MAG: hypothetical protein O8C56_10835 [Candidatus Methanoperedens sp.]|nr:hypothetical protein [Candidatus Methanoperedens sp.]